MIRQIRKYFKLNGIKSLNKIFVLYYIFIHIYLWNENVFYICNILCITRNQVCDVGGWQTPGSAGRADTLLTQEGPRCSSSLKARGRLATQRSWCFSLSPRAGKSTCPSSKPVFYLVSLLFYLDLQLIRWGPLALGRVICFIQSIDFKW